MGKQGKRGRRSGKDHGKFTSRAPQVSNDGPTLQAALAACSNFVLGNAYNSVRGEMVLFNPNLVSEEDVSRLVDEEQDENEDDDKNNKWMVETRKTMEGHLFDSFGHLAHQRSSQYRRRLFQELRSIGGFKVGRIDFVCVTKLHFLTRVVSGIEGQLCS